ncbi:MAG: hypothetical protein Q4F99_06125 [bacterium]|nr:hypothetical protein [bacterium]
MKFYSVALLSLCTTVLTAALSERPVYQPIIDAKPFGEIGEFKKATPEQLIEEQKQKEEIAKKFRMCGITDTPEGLRKIAFIDETNNEIANYMLAIGETQNGFTLVSADYEREYATIEKDGLTFTLGLGKGLIDEPPQLEAVEAIEIDQVEVRSQRNTRNQLTATPPPKKGSYRERLLKRQAAKKEKELQAQAAVTKELEAQAAQLKVQERRLQIERIKRGLAPTIPITLTPEEDRELAEAGVFDENEASEEETHEETREEAEEAQIINLRHPSQASIPTV